MRPELTKEISLHSFQEYYWLKEELQAFCREHGISASGSKVDIADRIATFLSTGVIKNPVRTAKNKKKSASLEPVSLNTVIEENHRCSQEVRAFFKSIIPKFHFSTYIQNYFKTNVGKTYQDAVEAWYEEERRKKEPGYKKDIAPQFEYNRFVQAFFLDPINKGKTREEAIEAWNRTKKQPGSNEYRREVLDK